MIEFTEQQLQEIADVEAIFVTYGQLIHGAFDESLTEFQREHCHDVLKVGLNAFHDELSREHGGETYPMGKLAAKIDQGIAQHTIQREVTA